METIEKLKKTLENLANPGHRGQLLARGLARGMIWSDGEVPTDGPKFGPNLTVDLLDHGYRLLDTALSLLEISRVATEDIERGLRLAGEAIESAVRKGKTAESARGFNLVCAASAFHIAHFSARSFCLLKGDLASLNLSSTEKMVCILMRRELSLLQDECMRWVEDVEHSDDRIASRLRDENDSFGPEDVIYIALASNFCRALATFEFGLSEGSDAHIAEAADRFRSGLAAAAKCGHVPMWWLTRLARFLIDDLWRQSYIVRLPQLPPETNSAWNTLRSQFILLLATRDLAHVEFWPSQLAAAERVIDTDDDLVVALPTSSGKTRIAEICILRTLAAGKRAIYVTPLRALSAQVEFVLASTFRPLGFSTTAVYGASGLARADVETIRSGHIVVATPEKLDFAIRQDPDVLSDVGVVVLDEGHMIGLGEREIRYEALVQRLLRRDDADERRIVCLSAIFSPGPSFDSFTEWIRSGRPGNAIRSEWKPTRQRRGELVWHGTYGRLDYNVDGTNVFVQRFVEQQAATPPRRIAFPRDRNELIVACATAFAKEGKAILIYCPIRKSVETLAEVFLTAHRQGFFSMALSDEHKRRIEPALRVGLEWLGSDHPAIKCLELGIAVHHGQLPRTFLREIESLLKERIIRLAISSPTLAQGVDLSFEILLFSSLWRNQKLIPPLEFANVIGRVGRAHVDIDGIYVLPAFDSVNARIKEFRRLDTLAKHRQMESGMLLLMNLFLEVFAVKLQIPLDQVGEYVLNNQDAWRQLVEGQDEYSKWAVIAANELDNAIFSTLSDLNCPVDELLSKIDEALRDSFWQKRIQTLDVNLRTAQERLLKSRAVWLWNNSTPEKRQGCFSAGIGFGAGEMIVSNSELLGGFLAAGEGAVAIGDGPAAGQAAIEIARILLSICPFACDLPDRWEVVINEWITGTPTSSFADADEIAFIQDGIVYRLVWAIESVRTTLHAIGVLPVDNDDGNFGLCMTYGVPLVPAALILQSGLSSRRLALFIVRQFDLSFTTRKGLESWLREVGNGEVNPMLEVLDQPEWDRFVAETKRLTTQRWSERRGKHSPIWNGLPPAAGSRLRVRTSKDRSGIELWSPSLEKVGKIPGKRLFKTGRYSCRVLEGGQEIELVYFGPGS